MNNSDLLNNIAKQGHADLVYPLKKNGGSGKEALLADAQQLQWLRDNNRRLIIDAGKQILSGQLKLNPYRLIDGSKRRTGLDYTDYLDIYQFDSMLDQSLYHELDARIAKEKFDDVRKKEQNNDDGEDQ